MNDPTKKISESIQAIIAERDEARAEIERLRAIVKRLPKTADGVPLFVGQSVWIWSCQEVRQVTISWISQDSGVTWCAFEEMTARRFEHEIFSTKAAVKAGKE